MLRAHATAAAAHCSAWSRSRLSGVFRSVALVASEWCQTLDAIQGGGQADSGFLGELFEAFEVMSERKLCLVKREYGLDRLLDSLVSVGSRYPRPTLP